jgi:ribulose-phosphate 3-epimerase
MFLIMTVEPGFGGQKFMSEMMEKVRLTRKSIGDRPIWLQVDGGISIDTIAIAREAGADTFVAGSAVFNSPEPAVMVEMLRHRASTV